MMDGRRSGAGEGNSKVNLSRRLTSVELRRAERYKTLVMGPAMLAQPTVFSSIAVVNHQLSHQQKFRAKVRNIAKTKR